MSKKKGRTLPAQKRVLLFEDARKMVRLFGGAWSDDACRQALREKLGGKGAALAEMSGLGIRVPPGLTITTDCCRQYYRNGEQMPEGLFQEVLGELRKVEAKLRRFLGDTSKPLLVSVRSGAKVSMPGMMDTILNLGLNDETVVALANATGNARFAWDSYRRFIEMYSDVVLGIARSHFEPMLRRAKQRCGVSSDHELGVADLQQLVSEYKALVEKTVPFPQDVHEQLQGAIEAVFRSWQNNRAVFYRNLHKIDHDIGTAVTVQAMVFGNLSNSSGTGVCFSRDPATGQKQLYGEYLVNAQGEDVVAGTHKPQDITALFEQAPDVYEELKAVVEQLECHYRDAQDIEFTVEDDTLYILQTRNAKRTAQAAVSIAVAMASEHLITAAEALLRVEPDQIVRLLLPSFNPASKESAQQSGRLIATGLKASPGAATGRIVFSPDQAERLAAAGQKVMLVRVETCPDDIHGIVAAQGVVTARGGMTSHAAVVARGMGKPCVAGCSEIVVDEQGETLRVGARILGKDTLLSIDGSTGEVFEGEIAMTDSSMSSDLQTLLSWADCHSDLGVLANADTPQDARKAIEFGAAGIGLCRTEHMFMDASRLPVVQEMILCDNDSDRQSALNKLLPMQAQDFLEIFREMDGLPVTIRLLDPPLHEFLPKEEALRKQFAQLSVIPSPEEELRLQVVMRKVNELREVNPMMGLRGCRLGLLYPQIVEMQVRAIFEAAAAAAGEGCLVLPAVMVPLVGHENELAISQEVLDQVAREVMSAHQANISCKFGTMIEVPRAALVADRLAAYAQFFSFGTNDLTQMTFGFSRDDAESKFLRQYVDGIEIGGAKRKILLENPFEVLDEQGVGKLIEIAVAQGKRTRPDLQLGICGEHGGNPHSIAAAQRLGMNYVSCSPYRVPVARLAAAHAAILSGRSAA